MNSVDAKLLGLTKNQQRLLRALKGGPHSVSALTTRSGLARMTVYSVLASLSRRSLVLKVPYGKRYRYSAADTIQTIQTTAPAIRTIQGWKSILDLYRQLMSEHRNRRVYAIQPPRSARGLLARDSTGFAEEINADIKKYRVIIDVITSPAILDLSSTQPATWKKSMLGRTTSVTLLPDELLELPGELWIFQKTVLITDWEKETCTVLSDKAAIDMYRALYAMLKESGRIVDSNEFLRQSF